MVRKSLATFAVAASLLATSAAGVAFAKGPESEHGFPEKGMIKKEMQQLKRAERTAPITTQCTFSALDKRDTSVVAALDAYNVGIKTALSARKVAITAALAITDETAKKDALKKAGETYKIAIKKQKNDLKIARKAAVTAMSTELKACGENTISGRAHAHFETQL